MKIADFGHHDRSIVLCGGIQSNLSALTRFSQVVGDAFVISTGDIVGFAGAHDATVTLFRRLGWVSIAGDADRAPGPVGQDTRNWLDALPDIAVFTQGDRRYAVVHGALDDPARAVWPSMADADFRREIETIEATVGPVDGVVAGHAGVAFHRLIGRHQWINAGALGMPPHDGRPETRYAVLSKGDVIIERLSYDHTAARAAVLASNTDHSFADTLSDGIWPSEEALPPELRR